MDNTKGDVIIKFYHITLLILPLLFVVGLGCEQRQQEWESFLLKYKEHDIRSVTDSEKWISKHRDEISIPSNIKFGKPHRVSEISGATIAVDLNDKHRVILTKERAEWELRRDEWESWLKIYKDVLKYHVLLSVTDSEKWISKHRDEINIPGNIEFGKPHVVYYGTGLPSGVDGFAIAVDPNDKHRVLIRSSSNGGQQSPPPGPIKLPPGYLSEAESLEWLSENGYEVEKSLDGSRTIKKSMKTENIDSTEEISMDGTIIGYPLEKGASLTVIGGKIYIKNKE